MSDLTTYATEDEARAAVASELERLAREIRAGRFVAISLDGVADRDPRTREHLGDTYTLDVRHRK